MGGRQCVACCRFLDKEAFSSTQWDKKGDVSCCRACFGHGVVCHDATQTARRNDCQQASFKTSALRNPFASGAFRWVAKGEYTGVGGRSGQPCVCKWFKTADVMEKHFFQTDIATSKKAIEIISKWNAKGFVNKMIRVNLPEVWTFDTSSSLFGGRQVMQEPFIANYQKFNSNTGWSDDTLPWPRVMQALSHFSYHYSQGQCLLCDLQGGVYSHGAVLTDPVIMSSEQSYGPTDLGLKGMSTFFAHHVCNEFCRSDWIKPCVPTAHYMAKAGTTMEQQSGRNYNSVPTQFSRPPMSLGRVYE